MKLKDVPIGSRVVIFTRYGNVGSECDISNSTGFVIVTLLVVTPPGDCTVGFYPDERKTKIKFPLRKEESENDPTRLSTHGVYLNGDTKCYPVLNRRTHL